MELKELIQHPELMDRDTLYELRSMLALYPYFQTARLLMLQNLYLLHDPTFDEELRRAAVYITDRRVLFQLIEAPHYQLSSLARQTATQQPEKDSEGPQAESASNRTLSLIDTFLDSIPHEPQAEGKHPKRKPTPADAAIDYMAYLLETEDTPLDNTVEVPQMKGQSLIEKFINHDKGRIQLPEEPTLHPTIDDNGENDEIDTDESYFTETLARIYIKQGRYSKALEIIRRLSLQFPKKNAYFADQIRFLEKLIINNNKNKK
ncbi:MAG: tetratricopeptide repeat protein [Prevotella sp.]|nr:tetratricopeptide repeat protein [Prevotella sp.]